MKNDEAESLLSEIQRAFDGKNLEAALAFYHADVGYIGPAYPQPLEGKDTLRKAFGEHFQSPHRTRVSIRDVRVRELTMGVSIVHCLVEGVQGMLFAETRFKGLLSRVFIDEGDGPKIIHEHFSLLA